jgi:hypothetical protein
MHDRARALGEAADGDVGWEDGDAGGNAGGRLGYPHRGVAEALVVEEADEDASPAG